MNKLVELNREYWGRVHDMCNGTGVKPWECVKQNGRTHFEKHPKFSAQSDAYEFAVAILEGKPVFPGSEIYHKCDGEKVIITSINTYGEIIVEQSDKKKRSVYPLDDDDFTWTQPSKSRTFTLNGKELPCPIVDTSAPYIVFIKSDNERHRFYFSSVAEKFIVLDAFIEVLTLARDKQ